MRHSAPDGKCVSWGEVFHSPRIPHSDILQGNDIKVGDYVLERLFGGIPSPLRRKWPLVFHDNMESCWFWVPFLFSSFNEWVPSPLVIPPSRHLGLGDNEKVVVGPYVGLE